MMNAPMITRNSSIKQLPEDLKILLLGYRRENIILSDKVSNYANNLMPVRDELIATLKLEVAQLKRDRAVYEGDQIKTKGWLFS